MRIPTGTAPYLGIPQAGAHPLIFRRTLLERGLRGAEVISVEIAPGDGNGRPTGLRVRYKCLGGRGCATLWAQPLTWERKREQLEWAHRERHARGLPCHDRFCKLNGRKPKPKGTARELAIAKLERQIAKLEGTDGSRWAVSNKPPVNPLLPRERYTRGGEYERNNEAQLHAERPLRKQLARIAALVFGLQKAALSTIGDAPWEARQAAADRAGYKALREAGFTFPTQSQMDKRLSVRVGNSGGYWKALPLVVRLSADRYSRKPEDWARAMEQHKQARREYAERLNEIASLKSQIEGIRAMEEPCEST